MYTAFGTLERYTETINDAEAKATVQALVKGLKERVGREVVLTEEVDTAFAAAGLAELSADFKARINDLITDLEIELVGDAIRASYVDQPTQVDPSDF